MKMIFSNKILIYIISILIFSCNNKQKFDFEQYEPKEFIDEFFEMNSETIFIDEIERIKINYFNESNFFIYTFKNENKLNEEGKLFLQLFAQDTSNLPDHRKAYGCMNLSINKKEVLKFNETRNFLIKKLQFPYKIKSIRTGNIFDNKKVWKTNYNNVSNLNDYRSNALLINSDEDLIFDKFNNSMLTLGNTGTKVYSNGEKKIETYYNTNTLTLTTYFGNLKKVINSGDYTIEITLKDNTKKNYNVSLDQIHQNKNLGLNFTRFNDSLNIKTISIGQQDWKKKIDVYKLIHYTHVKRIKSKDFNASSDTDRTYSLISYFLNNTLKNLYSKDNEIDIYINGSRKSIYLKKLSTDNKKSFIALRVFSTNKEYTNRKHFKEIKFNKRKKLLLQKKSEKVELYHVQIPFDAYKIEFGTITDSNFNTFYTFEK